MPSATVARALIDCRDMIMCDRLLDLGAPPTRRSLIEQPGATAAGLRDHRAVTNTRSINPESLREYIDERVRAGSYGNTSEYLRDLIRRDRHEQAAVRLRGLIADGLASGEGRATPDEVIAVLREQALGADA